VQKTRLRQKTSSKLMKLGQKLLLRKMLPLLRTLHPLKMRFRATVLLVRMLIPLKMLHLFKTQLLLKTQFLSKMQLLLKLHLPVKRRSPLNTLPRPRNLLMSQPSKSNRPRKQRHHQTPLQLSRCLKCNRRASIRFLHS